jgi:hypothetical protein
MPVPFGKQYGSVALTKFTGHVNSGVLENSNRSVFFSPALVTPVSGTEVDVSSVQARVIATDGYVKPQPATAQAETRRPFLLGPPPGVPSPRLYPPDFTIPSYVPVMNDPSYGFANVKPGSAVRGVLYNTTTLQTDILLV